MEQITDKIPIINLSEKSRNYKLDKRCPICGYGIGMISVCYKCNKKEYYKQYYLLNKQKFIDTANKKYNDNKEECLKKMNKYYLKNKEKLKMYNHQYYLKNKEEMQINMKKYYEENKVELNRKGMLKKKEKMKQPGSYLRLVENLRSRVSMAVKYHKGIKACSAIKLLGADIDTVRKHLQSQFKDGMTWENQGAKGWHVDHIIPCNSFDLTKEEEQTKCFHYTNLQPLWANENLRKGCKI
jgi:hypothetical protein